MGPALLPESLERLRKPEALKVITQGRAATQMPGFADRLSAEQIAALAEWIYTPVTPAPTLGRRRHPRLAHRDRRRARRCRPGRRGAADPMNLFVVVEGGDHHVSLVDGDRFEVIHRFAVALRAARRAEVHARRALRLLRLARRLGHEVRPLEPERRRRGARRA